MTARDNSPTQERRVSSFRIDDILATPSEPRELTQRAANTTPTSTTPTVHLSFGVDQLLANRDHERRSPLNCYGRLLRELVISIAAILCLVVLRRDSKLAKEFSRRVSNKWSI